VTLFVRRLIGAAMLDGRIYEDVEADRRATGQAVAVVLLAGVIGALVGWIAWAMLTYLIGTHLLPEPQTRADAGQLLRTTAFASAPGLVRAFGVIPGVGVLIYAITSVWMLLAMIVAVRQALDYRSTGRAVAVCAVGWALSLAVAAIIAIVFAPTVS
jgi:hypothetical protein